MIPLIILRAKGKGEIEEISTDSIIEILNKKEWKNCFFNIRRTKQDTKKLVKSLCKLIESIENKEFSINEEEKVRWVNTCYKLLEESYKNPEDFPVNLGSYLDSYYDTLEVLDHGYCSDSKMDAQNLFREVKNVSVIPIGLKENFVKDLESWLEAKCGKLNYMDFSNEILKKYIVDLPFYSWQKSEKEPVVENLDKITSLWKNHEIYNKLRRWLTGVYFVDLPYDGEKGLVLE